MFYMKKPVVVEAEQWTGDYEDICDFVGKKLERDAGTLFEDGSCGNLLIPTLEGIMTDSPYDYIIKGLNGEVYPCKPDIFRKTYEKVGN